MFDILGKITPIISGFKYDLRTLISRKLDWDDKIPNDLQALGSQTGLDDKYPMRFWDRVDQRIK